MMKRTKHLLRICSALCTTMFSMGAVHAGETTRVSVSNSGAQANHFSMSPSLSGDGRYVVFTSYASNLVSSDTNNFTDVFVRDLQTNNVALVSVSSDGIQGSGHSDSPSISRNGRYVAFRSEASKLVSSDTGYYTDIFVRDLQTNSTTCVSVSSNGELGNDSSESMNGDSISISNDGRYIAFSSSASNLVNDDTNGYEDVFVRDRQTNTTTRVSVSSSGEQGNYYSGSASISDDGRYIAFSSQSDNLVSDKTNYDLNIFVHDRQTASTTRLNFSLDGTTDVHPSAYPRMSGDGRYIVFLAGRNNNVYVHDRQAKTTKLVNVSTTGGQSNGDCFFPAISRNGRYAIFSSDATNLVANDTNDTYDVFVRNLQNNTTTRVSLTNSGGESNNLSRANSSISENGIYVAFASLASNLVSGDTNDDLDIFMRDLTQPTSLTINNARTAAEGSASRAGFTTFTVTLSAANAQNVIVDYQTADGTAKAGSDYVARNGKLSFVPGETVKYVSVDFIGDSGAEANETFFLDLKTSVNTTITDSRGSAYIRNDDGPSITIDNAVTKNEGDSGTTAQNFMVHLSTASTDTVTVSYATSNGTAGPADYAVASGTLTFAPGETSKIITILLKGDTIVEPTETYRVNLKNPTYAVLTDSQGIGYIRNDDGAALLFDENAPSE